MTDKAPGLKHNTIGELEGGGIGYAIDRSIAEVLADCGNRPALNKARTVTITVKLTPTANNSLDAGTGGMTGVAIEASVKHALPPRAGGVEILGVRAGVDTNGEALTEAVFTQVPLLRVGSN